MIKHRLEIKMNNSATNDPCAICGQRTDPDVGPEIFLMGTWSLVCHECGKAHGPALMLCLYAGRVEAHEQNVDMRNGERFDDKPVRFPKIPVTDDYF
jgi:hypothetical protein